MHLCGRRPASATLTVRRPAARQRMHRRAPRCQIIVGACNATCYCLAAVSIAHRWSTRHERPGIRLSLCAQMFALFIVNSGAQLSVKSMGRPSFGRPQNDKLDAAGPVHHGSRTRGLPCKTRARARFGSNLSWLSHPTVGCIHRWLAPTQARLHAVRRWPCAKSAHAHARLDGTSACTAWSSMLRHQVARLPHPEPQTKERRWTTCREDLAQLHSTRP